MNFGNWKLSADQIEYAGGTLKRFVIPVRELLDKIAVGESGGSMYKWILLATEEDALTIDELYDLNFAFVYTAGRLGLDLDYAVFDSTVEYQFQALDDEDDDDDDGTNDDTASLEQLRKNALSERD